eukprot:TRINITY_DN15299_c0_g1_i1.p2 TRINITY_DN15299_c0_g1~~TRINITY_DN15299_c0_g1_i1.p2  ORF type:complete len:112 (+),score=21.59 TRINITY_DN15299_c0_g1_i1:60-395(+)
MVSNKNSERAQHEERVRRYFGHKTSLEVMQEICNNLIGSQPDSVKAGKRMLSERKIFIHIFDYVDFVSKRAEEPLIFHNRRDLRNRCKEIGYSRKIQAKEEGFGVLLKKLL